MKTRILERYRSGASGTPILDITAARVEDLYNNFDKQAPYVIKELDTDLVDYIIDSARELGKSPFIICFRLASDCHENIKARVRTSIRNYFLYIRELKVRELKRTGRTSITFIVVGLAIMFISVWVNRNIDDNTPVFIHVLAEGLTVAAWVALWQALANILIDWWPIRKDMLLYGKISRTRVEFEQPL